MDIDKLEAGREMDSLVAERVMGWKISKAGELVDYGIGYLILGKIELVKDTLRNPRGLTQEIPPAYSTDIAAAWQVEERIAELGLIEEYCYQLTTIANLDKNRDYYRHPQRWQLIHATPADRCRAALKAIAERK